MIVKKPCTNIEYANLAVYCNENNCHIEDRGMYYESVENAPPPPPTYDEVSEMRKQYRREHIDDKTAERSRKIANGSWTEQDEQDYLALDAEVTAWIEENLPYPVGEDTEES